VLDSETMEFLDRCLVVLRWKKLILLNTLLVAAASVVVALALPKWYLSVASLFPPEEDTISLSGISSSLASAASMVSGPRATLPIWATPSDVYSAVLHSRIVRSEVIRRNDLLRVYQAPDTDRAIQTFNSLVKIKVGGEGVVQIKVLDKDPKRAAAIANDLVDMLDRVNREKRNTSARQARVFIEGRLEQNRRDLARAEQTLRATQESTGVMIPEDQLKAMIDASAAVEVELLLREVDLGVMRSQVGSGHPGLVSLEREVSSLRRRMRELQQGEDPDVGMNADEPGRSAPEAGLGLPLKQYPGVQLVYLRAFREVTVQEAIYELLTQQYERYRIQESRDTPTVQVLDPAVPATYKAKPIRWLICVSATFVAFVLSVLLALFFESLRRMRGESPERFERVRRIAAELRLGRALERL
jgi:tyrosine-protein kinase Etk/Wzc